MMVVSEIMPNSTPRSDRILRWIARIWSLPAILFLLGEIIFPHGGDEPVPFLEWLALGLLVTAVLGLALAWRWEVLGGSVSIFAITGSFIILSIDRGTLMWRTGLLWFGFIIAPAALFLACGLRAKGPDLKAA